MIQHMSGFTSGFRKVRVGVPGRIARGLLFALAFLAVTALLRPASVIAQDVPSDTIPHYNLDSLVVSVLRSPVRVGESPYAVSVLGIQELQRGKTGMYLEEAMEGLPGVQVQNRFNYAVGERVSIRGFGARAQFGIESLHVEVDGIPATLADGQSTIDHLDLGSLGRVEALRGPASSLYGNSSGGVLLFETRSPATVPIREEVTAVGGSDGLLRLQSTTTGTVANMGYVFSLDRMSYDGFRETDAGDSYGGADRFHVNGRLNSPLAGGDLNVTVNFVDLDAENPGSIPNYDNGREDINEFVYVGNGTGKTLQQAQLGANWTGVVDRYSLQASVYGLGRDFQNPIPFNYIDVDRRAGGARLSLGSPGDRNDSRIWWQAGVSYDIQDDDRREFDNDSGNPTGPPNQDQAEKVQTFGYFGQAGVSLDERLDLTAGLRYDEFQFEVDDRIPLSQHPFDDSGKRVMDSWSPTLGIHFEATPDVGIFANYATFFETPTTVKLANRESGAGGFNPDLDPQTGTTLEAGIRGTSGDRVSWELTAYTTNLEDEMIQYEIPSQPGVNYFRNAGESSRDGIEAVIRARLHERLTGQISYAHTSAEFDDYVVDAGTDDEADYSGNQVPGLAPNKLQASLRYGPESWFLELAADYTDEIPVNDANAAFADSYTLFDIRGGLSTIQVRNVELSPFAGIRNLTDELYTASVAVNAFGGRFFEPGPGRTFYLGLTTAF